MISVTCSTCQNVLDVPEQYAGTAGTCKKCGGRIVVPSMDAGGSADLPLDLASALDESLSAPRPTPVVRPVSMGDRLQPLIKPVGVVLAVVIVGVAVYFGAAHLPEGGFAGSPGSDQIAGEFMAALSASDLELCSTYLTEGSRANFRTMYPGLQQTESYVMGVATESGTTSEVGMKVTQLGMQQDANVLLRKEGGNWRVYGLKMVPMPGMDITLDFENPESVLDDVQKMMEGMPPEMMQEIERAMKQQQGFQ